MSASPSDRLFDEFPVPSRQEWLDLVTAELDGASFAETLVWNTLEGFGVQPLYTAEDVHGLPHLGSLPGLPSFTRGCRPSQQAGAGWYVAQEISHPDPREANKLLLAALQAGQTGAVLRFAESLSAGACSHDAGIRVRTAADLSLLLADVPVDEIPIHFDAGASAPEFYALLMHWAETRGEDARSLSGSLGYDPLSELITHGTARHSLSISRTIQDQLIRHARDHCPALRTLSVNGAPYYDAGASAVQELAFSLAAGVEYLDGLLESGLPVDEAAGAVQWVFPVGTNFFFEIAKLRAARMLWAKIVHHFGAGQNGSLRMAVRTESSERSRTLYDPYVNMLRATVEVMGAALGGADAVTCAPFDSQIRPTDDFSRRLARNTQIVLMEESHLSRVLDPAGGSYYVEHLTDAIGRHAWALFQEIERRGGFLRAFESGWAQRQIAEVASVRQERISKRQDVLIGTNQYPNLGESLADYLRDVPSATEPEARPAATATAQSAGGKTFAEGQRIETMIRAAAGGATLETISELLATQDREAAQQLTPLPRHRDAEMFERIRIAVEQARKRPRVFLATLGPATRRRARATFAAGFLGIAGFEIIDNMGFDTVDAAAWAIAESHPEVVVVCSDDASYPEIVPELISAVEDTQPRPVVVVAGNPAGSTELLRQAGVDEFIHAGSDAGAVLRDIVARLGITIEGEGDADEA